LHELRKRAVRMRRQGHTHKAVAAAFGVGESTVRKWWALAKPGASGLKPAKPGRKPGEKRRLRPEQEEEIRGLIASKTPDQLKLSFALWTRRAVTLLIRERFGIAMPVRTMGEYLKRWDFTPQKPLKRAYEQNPKAVQRWLDEEYPAIHGRAKAEGAEIHWGDETGLCTDDQRGRGYAPKGKTPTLRLNAKRTSASLISTVTNQGKVRFMVFDGGMNVSIFLDFLKRLIRDAGRKIFLVVDNLRVHHAKLAQAWLAEHQEEIEVFHLPSYSPELNPDELLNGDLKAGVHGREPSRNETELKRKISSHLRMLQKRPDRVKKYFTHQAVRYAA